jgi:hypothetical protein
MSIFLLTYLYTKGDDNYIITSVVDFASNDNHVSYEKAIKFDRALEKNIVINEQDNR